MGPRDASEKQQTVCTDECGARCCRYITTSIETPRARNDWDEIRWWLAHPGTMVTKDDDGWMLHVETRCRYLGDDLRCRVYEDRMIACAVYDTEACEFTGEVPYEVRLRSESDLADYLERRKLKRGADVAKRIRRAGNPVHNPGTS
jgi:hypothetical protein